MMRKKSAKMAQKHEAQRADPAFAKARAERHEAQRPDPGFAKAKALADRGLISQAEMQRFQNKTWRKGKKA